MNFQQLPLKTRLQTLDLLKTPMWLFDGENARLWWANQAAVELWGVDSLENLLARDMAVDMPDMLRFQQYRNDLRQGVAVSERWVLFPDTQPTPLDCTCSCVLLDDGREALLIESVAQRVDIETQRNLEALRQSERLLAEAESIAKLGSWRLDVASGKMYWSKEALRIFGMNPEAPGPDFEEHKLQIHREDRSMWLKVTEQAMQDGIPFEHQFRNILPDGTSRVIDARGQCKLDDSGKVVQMSGTVQDVTKRVRMEKMKSEFVSTVSHELRTPLTSIRGSLGLIVGGAVGELPPKASGLLRIAYKNSERLVALVNDILDIQKIESGRMDFHMRPIDLIALIENAMEANQAYAQQYEVALSFEKRLPNAQVLADFDRLMQVMANLISNATKFSPRSAKVEIVLERYSGMFRVSIRDHGSGIPKEFQPRIFEKFAQADGSDTRQKGGTGLGLSIAKAIIKRHWGTIGFVSDGGDGSTFYFDLPEYHQRKTIRSKEEPTDQRRLLVCEDDRDTSTLLRLMLEREGYAVDIAYSAEEALESFAQNRYAAMTVDLLLPDQDGVSLIRTIRESPHGRALPIIVVSIRAAEGRKELSGEAFGIVDWLSKPIDTERLLHAVKQAMRHLRKEKAHVLHVEDDLDVLKVVSAVLGDTVVVDAATSLGEAKDKLQDSQYDLVIIDIGLPDGSGLALLEAVKECVPRPPVLVFSAQECDNRVAQEVSTVLVKSRTTNRQLSDAIKSLINGNTQHNDGDNDLGKS